MDNNNMKYRNIKYNYHEWKTFDGRLVTGYHCEDKKLLNGLDTISFGAKTINEMQEYIDDYIDNRQEKLDNQVLTDSAMAEYYAKWSTAGEF
tara:strand:+ start:986 stop:1261 length:276 start_codon:yes stop_codon:yes gene_type:complete